MYLAGGGDASTFDELWALELAAQDRMMEDIAAQRYLWGGGFLMYVVAGRKAAVA